jgi:hypothetical protein
MPNWCDNRLAIRGARNVVIELVELLEGDTPFDFERVLPMPKTIQDGGAYDGGMLDMFPGWYQWSRQNWGVKWNATSVTRRGYGRTGRVRYRFFTAYGPPTELLDELARRFATVELDLSFDVEMLGCGSASWRDGARVEYEEMTAF